MAFKRFLLALPVLLILLLSLALHAPARILAGLLSPGMQVQAWGGSLVDGQLTGMLGTQPLHLDWTLKPAQLLWLTTALDARAQGPLDARMLLARGPRTWSVSFPQLRLAAGPLPALGGGTVTPAWQGRDLEFARRHAGAWVRGAGSLLTAGGPLRLSLQGQMHELLLPAARISWSVRDEALIGELRQQSDNAALATLTLSADHRIQWQLRDRLLRLKAGYQAGNDPDLIVLTVSEPL